MSQTFNIYCDESCHLEHDHQNVMALGAIWCPLDKTHEIASRIGEIKSKYHIGPYQEVKWTRVCDSRQQFYCDLIDYFFDNDDLSFRGLVILNKSRLEHTAFRQTHDDWYYKMYFLLLSVILSPRDRYRIYLDIKDTRGAAKARHLREVLCNSKYDFSQKIIEWIQLVRSHEVQLFQLTDLLIGALTYLHRDLHTSKAKQAIIKRIQDRSGYSLRKSTLLREKKLNLLCWEPSDGPEII